MMEVYREIRLHLFCSVNTVHHYTVSLTLSRQVAKFFLLIARKGLAIRADAKK